MGPFLIPDVGRGLSSPEFEALAADPQVVGVILKISQGLDYDTRWIRRQWRRILVAAGSRYGRDFFRTGYHFLTPQDGEAQCEFALDIVEDAGGWETGDMPLAMDIEGDAWHNSKQLRRRVAAAFARRYHELTGRMAMFYGNGDIGIGPDDGFDIMWTPHPGRLADWPVERFVLDQYAGLNKGHVSYYDPSSPAARRGLPLRIHGWGGEDGTDLNVVLDEHGSALVDPSHLRARLLRT